MSPTDTDLVLPAVAVLLFVLALATLFWRKRRSLAGRHVLITGGSSGIGLSMASAAAAMGADVTIVSRNEEKLMRAHKEITAKVANPERQRVRSVKADVAGDFAALDAALKDVTRELGPVYLLINNAGTSIPRRFVEADLKESRFMMDVNYFGSLNVTKSLLPQMQDSGDGVIIFVASQAALIGISGLAAYCGSKYAVRGFAEALAMEVRPHGINVTLCCPPDTDTPGFEEEQKSKPEECKIISGSGTPSDPNTVARAALNDALAGKFYSSPGLDGFMLTNLNAAATSASFPAVVLQTLLAGPMRLTAWIIQSYFQYVVYSCKKNRDIEKRKTQ